MKKSVFVALGAGLLLLAALLVVVLLGKRVRDHFSPAVPSSDVQSTDGFGPGAVTSKTPYERFHELGLPAPEEPIAICDGQNIPCREFYRLLVQNYGLEILAQQIQDKLVQQEAVRRGIVVPEAEVDAKVNQVRKELKVAPGPQKTLEALLAEKKMTIGQFKRELRDQIALEQMVRRDLRLPESATVQDEHIEKWVAGVRSRAKMRGAREGLPPGVTAMVNGQQILEADIIQELADRVPRPDLEKLVERLLDDKIVEKLMQDQKINIRDSDLEVMTRNLETELHKRPGMAGVTLENYLHASNKTLGDVQEQFRHAIGLRKIVARQVTEAQLRLAFNEFQEAYTGKMVHAQHILALAVDVDTMQPRDAQAFDRARTKIENIQRQIKSGARFEEMARKESDDPGTAKKGGDLGFIRRLGDVPEEVAAMAFLLKADEISPPVRSAYGCHLVRALEVRPGKPVRFEDVREQVLRDVVVATCDRWLQNYKRSLQISVNLGTMGRTDAAAGASAPRAGGHRSRP